MKPGIATIIRGNAHSSDHSPGFIIRIFIAGCIGTLTQFSSLPQSFAADYPDRPIHLIVPFPAGSSVDTVARPLAQGLTMSLGQQVVVENRPGAGTITGTAAVARAEPDGYTMLLVTGALTAQASLSKLPYDPIRDFAPITQVAASCGLVMLVHKDLHVNSIADVVELAKKTPDKLSYATLGYGSSTHVAGALFAEAAGIKLIAVPYASANLMTDFVAHRVDMAFVSTVSALAPIKTGQVHPLAVTGPKRCELFPNVPTLQEDGYKDFDREGYFGLAFPAKTSPAYVDRIYMATLAVLKMPEMVNALHASGLRGGGSSPKEFGDLLQEDLNKEAAIIKRLGIVKH
jgi:tripartite-type tricarboxylate transporter receptor subunit TctC